MNNPNTWEKMAAGFGLSKKFCKSASGCDCRWAGFGIVAD
jgi:hypothetical protein